MYKMIALEIRRNCLRPYHMATLICGITMLAFQFLLAAIPYMDPNDVDVEQFSSYPFLLGMTSLVSMAAFAVLSATMASQFVVEEYSGKRAILLLSYPISRKKVLCAKMILVFLYPVGALFLCGALVQAIFLITEALFPIGLERITLEAILQSLGFLFCCSILAGLLGVLSLWFGFRRKSIPATIVASVILASLLCQIVSAALAFLPVMGAALGVTGTLAALATKNLLHRVENLEV